MPSDPSARSIARILDSGLFDQSWVELQLRRRFDSPREAVAAYLDSQGCSPHPLFVAAWIPGRFGSPPAGVDPLVWYLQDERARTQAPTHPLVDPEVVWADHPGTHPHGALAAWLASATPETPLPAPPGLPRPSYGELVAASQDAVRDWQRGSRFRTAPRTTPTAPDWPDVREPRSTTKVSVVMPVWNRATQLRRAVASVQAQTHVDWELLVVDDGSEDDSIAVLSGIAHYDDRITIIPRPHAGVSAARNAAIERATGDFVAFLDSDNAWRPDFLARMVAPLERHGWAMAHAGLRAHQDGTQYFRTFEGTYDHLLVGNHVDLNVLVVRRDALVATGGFDVGLRRGVDYDLVLRLAREHELHLVPYLGVDYTDDQDEGPRISTSESSTWLSVIAARYLVDWDAARSAPHQDDLVSVVLPVRPGVRATIRAMTELGARPGVELVLVGVRLPRWHQVLLTQLGRAYGNIRLVTLEVDRGTALTLNAGAAAVRGSRVVLVGGPIDPEYDAILRLGAVLDDDDVAVAQAVAVGPGDLVTHAGAVFGRDACRPEPFLRDHPLADVDRAGDLAVPAAHGPVVALRTAELIEASGLDPLYGEHLAETDLSLRLLSDGDRHVRLCGSARFLVRERPDDDPAGLDHAVRVLDERYAEPPPGSVAAWTAAGYERVGHHLVALGSPDLADPLTRPVWVPRSVLRPVRVEVRAEAPPRLRWTIDLPSRGGRSAQGWGDYHYGVALAAALRRLDQHVSVDPREARFRPTRDHDDVILVLRGLDRVAPRPEAINVQWIISHPDDVTAGELHGYDLVYAASPLWAAERTAAWSIPVHPMLQATDPTLFHPDRASTSGAEVVFVGNTRGVFRTAVRHAVDHGLAVTVHGRGWGDMLGAGRVASEYVDNRELAVLYAGAGIVLNDHWDDMRLTGFVSNRLMDAAASGARVVSDSVPGIDLEQMFHGLVQTYESGDELADLVRRADEVFPDARARREAAALVAQEHSFDERARRLLDDVAGVLRR